MKRKWWIIQVGLIATSTLTLSTAARAHNYEVWIPDQSNSVGGVTQRGTAGGFLHIINNSDIATLAQPGGVTGSGPLPLEECFGTDAAGVPSANPGAPATPCDMNIVFPGTLTACAGAGSPSSEGTLGTIARMNGAVAGPMHQYMAISFFVPGGGYVGIMDGQTKRAIGLWRVTGTTAPTGGGRTNHMSFWNAQGTSLLIANLHGRLLERIDIVRDVLGNITSATFNKTASLAMAGVLVDRDAVAYQDDPTCNQSGSLISEVSGAYDSTPTLSAPSGAMGAEFVSVAGPGGFTTTWCKQNGCAVPGAFDGERGGNVVIFPNVASNGNVFTTFGGGGVLVADSSTTPMDIVGHYGCADATVSLDGTQGVDGAGFLGVETAGRMYLNSGVSSSPTGGVSSNFEIVSLPLEYQKFSGLVPPFNFPAPTSVFQDGSGVFNSCMESGPPFADPSQIVTDELGNVLASPAVRRDSHGFISTVTGRHLHNSDRIQNTVDVIKIGASANNTFNPYSLMSDDGSIGGAAGPCLAMGVTDDALLPKNDPAGGLLAVSPTNDVLFIALRGPSPVTTTHASQGSCPGVGVIRLSTSGDSGFLEKVIRTSNTVDTSIASPVPGGMLYTGQERSDVYSVGVRIK